MPELSHVRDDGTARMVDVSAKAPTARTATARASVTTRPEVMRMIAEGNLPKGEVLATARLAGIMAAKRTAELIPLCHPLPLTGIDVEVLPQERAVEITASVRTTAPTGVEMEALTAVSIAALTVYDMIKAVDRHATIERAEVVEKAGGAGGPWRRDEEETT